MAHWPHPAPVGPNLSPAARALLARQRGVIAAWQAAEVDTSPRALTNACRNGWQKVTARTFLDAAGPPTMAQLRVAGLLEAGPDAALTGCGALVEAGWTGDDAGFVDVVVARDHRSRRVRHPGWLRIHSTVEVPRRGGDPARAGAARAAIDAAVWARTPRELMFILTSTAQQRLTTAEQMRTELRARRRVAGARQIAEVLDAIELGVTSTNEMDFRRACRDYGLPAPRMQVRRVAGGRRRRIDAEFRTRSGRTVMVEVDGVAHMGVGQWQDDLIRQNELVTDTDARVLRISGWQVRHEPDGFFPLLARVLDQ
jgi:hypothetical protein